MNKFFLSFFTGGNNDFAMGESKAFRIKYDGAALAEHSIDINDLAPALLSLADLIQEANYIANKNEAKVSVKVKATEPGCFQIFIQANFLPAAVELLNSPPVTALSNLLGILGVGIGGTATLTFFYLLKKLKGRRAKIVKENAATLIIDTGDGEVEISKLEWDFLQSRKMRNAAYGLIKPLEKDGIETVDFIDVESETVATNVKKSEVLFFQPSPEPIEPLPEIPPRETFVNVVHMWFRDCNKWKFSEGGNEWSAEIKDNKFIEKLLKGDDYIRANDYLKVRVKQTQFRQGQSIQSEYEILEVLEHVKSYQQIPLG